ncbi:MAG: hypothetical protein RR690_06365 [Longicatena sp.]
MNTYTNKFEKLLKGVGILEMVFGCISTLILITSVMKLSSGEYVLLIPIWQYVGTAIVLILLQIFMGVFAIRYTNTDKVKYCVYVGFAIMICIALNTFILTSSQDTNIISFLSSILFPALYTAVAINLQNFHKHA